VITLFEICHTDEQMSREKPEGIELWDNRAAAHPEHREYPVFAECWHNVATNTSDLSYWGFISPKFSTKAGITPQEFKAFVERNESFADVCFINPKPINEAIFPNVIFHGELYHKGLSKLMLDTLVLMGYELSPTHIMDRSTFTFCNYFCGNRKFWSKYITFVTNFLDYAKLNPEYEKLLFETSADYSGDKNIPYYTFVVERLFSVFLLLHPQIVAVNYEYSTQQLVSKLSLPPEVVLEIKALSVLKTAICNEEILTIYSHYRNKLTTQHKYLFHME